MADKKQVVEQTAPVEDLSEMMKVRRDKLETYRSMGIAPFGHRYEVTYHAQDVRDEFSGVEDEVGMFVGDGLVHGVQDGGVFPFGDM